MNPPALALYCGVALPSFGKLRIVATLSAAIVAWCLTTYEFGKTAGAIFSIDLTCAILLLSAVCMGVWWWRKRRRTEPRALVGWCAIFSLLGSAALVWTARPYFAEQILIVRYNILPFKKDARGIPRGLANWLKANWLHPKVAIRWTSMESVSKSKLRTAEDLNAAMRLLAVCKPRDFAIFCPGLPDLRPLNELRELEKLTLYGRIQAGTPLPHLPSVRSLIAGDCAFRDFHRIAAIAPRISTLWVNESDGGKSATIDIAGIENLRQLDELGLYNVRVTGAGAEAALQRIPRVTYASP